MRLAIRLLGVTAGALLYARAGIGAVIVTIHNELSIARTSETVEIKADSLTSLGSDLSKIHVFDGTRELLAQSLDQSLIFQIDIGPSANFRSTAAGVDSPLG